MTERKYRWSFAELIDRSTIIWQKIIHAETDEMRSEFVKERDEIVHDLNLFISEGVKVTGEILVNALALQLVNREIWLNEAAGRGEDGKADYPYTHKLNSDRAKIKKNIQNKIGGRVDHKLNFIDGALDLRLP